VAIVQQFANQPQETKMFATTIIESTVTKRSGAICRLFSACVDRIGRYFAGRAAIEWLRELDDRALRDIGLARFQIEAAVHGFMGASELSEDISTTALPASVGLRARERASAAELVPWS
jgi:uncharacterized protein YjiS (DUF1127 family)